jgi:ABC-type branched-subunit amino acid transport system substrate-binding protein
MDMKQRRGSRLAAVGIVAAALSACASAAEPAAGPPPARPGVEAPEPDRADALTLAVLLPRSGSPGLEQYGALILEGVELAVAGHEQAGGRPVDLRIVDSGANPATTRTAVAGLVGGDAIAVVGPLLPEQVEAAAAGRGGSMLAILSPSSPDEPAAAGVYSLNAGDLLGVEALARYAAANKLGPIGILHPRTPNGTAAAAAFARVLAEAGMPAAARVAYDSMLTTFAEPMRELQAARVRALFIPAPERDVPQIAPQLEYYGLDNVQVLGGVAWTDEALLRSLPQRETEGVIATTPLLKWDTAIAWEDLVAAYEARHRRSLDHPFPALGYDAAGLVLAAVRAGADTPSEVARYLERGATLRGASGVIRIRDGRVEREPFIVRVQGGRLVKLAGPDRP